MNTAVFVSGTGSILAAMIEAGVPIDLVLADKECPGADIARAAGITTIVVPRKNWGYYKDCGEDWDRAGFTHTLAHILRGHDIEMVAMAGFFTILDGSIFQTYGGRILNIHPAHDIKRFPGATAVQDQLDAGVEVAGTTIHVATEVTDDPRFVIATEAVPVLPGDIKETLHERIKRVERKLYPAVLLKVQAGELDPVGMYNAAA